MPAREPARRALLAAAAAGALAPVLGAPAEPRAAASLTAGFSSLRAGSALPEGWREERLRGVAPNQHELVGIEGRAVLRIMSRRSASSLVWRFATPVRPARLTWRWRVDAWPAAAVRTAFGEKAGDDFGLRLYLLFDYPTSRVPIDERMLLAMARALYDPAVPAATLCYVADPRAPAGTIVPSAYSARVKLMVLRSDALPGPWWVEERDLLADFQHAFGAEHGPGMPPIAAVALAADTDQAGGELNAFFGDLEWSGVAG